MQKLSALEKKEILAGFAKKVTTPKVIEKEPSPLDSKYRWFVNNVSLLALSSIPGLITFGEELYSLFAKKSNHNFYSYPSGGRSYGTYGGGFNSLDNRRNFYAYASEAYRPTMRFTSMPFKNGINFGMPWLV